MRPRPRPRSRDGPRATIRHLLGTSGDRRLRRREWARSQRPTYCHGRPAAFTRPDLEAASEKLRLLANAGQAQMALGADARGIEARASVSHRQANLARVAIDSRGNVLTLAVTRRVRQELLGRAEKRDLRRQWRLVLHVAD